MMVKGMRVGLALIGWIVLETGAVGTVSAQVPPGKAAEKIAAHAHSVSRRVVMKDAKSVKEFQEKLEKLKQEGLFRQTLPGDPKKPQYTQISFLASGNYLLVVGDPKWVASEIENIRLMAFLFERPTAHLQMNLRVVQLTGQANTEVIQMTEAVRALVDTQRTQVVTAFADLQDYLLARLKKRKGDDLRLYDTVRKVMPGLGNGKRPLTVPEILLLIMLDRSLPALPAEAGAPDATSKADQVLMALPDHLRTALDDPKIDNTAVPGQIEQELTDWRQAVAAAADWCHYYNDRLKKNDGITLSSFSDALARPDCPLPQWVSLRLRRSLDLTERLYPDLAQKQAQESLLELERRFRLAQQRTQSIEESIARLSKQTSKGSGKESDTALSSGDVERQLLDLKSVTEELVSAPVALFNSVGAALDASAPSEEQLIAMFQEYAQERGALDDRLDSEDGAPTAQINYAKLETLEAGLNLWLRRASEGMSRALEQQFYSRYAEQIRLLANKRLGKSSGRDLLASSGIEEVPDIARDLLLADTGVNVFVSNSVSLQFAPDTTNTVSAQVQARLPSDISLQQRVDQAAKAAGSLEKLSSQYGIDGKSIVQALLSGGQAVPVQAGISLSANPSIGYDASTVSLTLTANQTMSPNSSEVTDRVTRHSIDNATVTVLSYEPMVLSTLTSNVSYFANTGGVPGLKRVPIIKDILNDFGPLKEGKRVKGVYQSSVLILEPVVIPTIEDLVRFQSGWRGESAS
jgi:hypothetical protein